MTVYDMYIYQTYSNSLRARSKASTSSLAIYTTSGPAIYHEQSVLCNSSIVVVAVVLSLSWCKGSEFFYKEGHKTQLYRKT
jgi:hypothetical protein